MGAPPDDERVPVASKKRSAPADKELRATVEKLRSKLERAEAKVERWKSEAGKLEKSSAELESKLKKAQKRAKRLESAAAQPASSVEPGANDEAAESVGTTGPAAPGSDSSVSGTPDSTWTVVQLRAEARSRGLSGLSNKSKADLLDALG